MQTRKTILIDESKCNGCELCVKACHEGAIQMVNGKAKLVNESYCDGLGACIGDCPEGAITLIDSPPRVVSVPTKPAHHEPAPSEPLPCGCPGSAMKSLKTHSPAPSLGPSTQLSQLSHWPIQLKLIPPTAPYLQNADLIICADCAPFVVPDFHKRYLQGRKIAVGCPKLDDLPFYAEKLKTIFQTSRPNSLMVLRMEVPCCAGIAQVTLDARNAVCPEVPMEIHTLGVEGDISIKRC